MWTADLPEGLPRKAVPIVRRTDHVHRITVHLIFSSTKSPIGEKLKASGRLVIYVVASIQIYRPRKIWFAVLSHDAVVPDRLFHLFCPLGQLLATQQSRQDSQPLPHQYVAIGEIRMNNLIVGGLEEGRVEGYMGMPPTSWPLEP